MSELREKIAAKVHEAWMDTKRRQGVTSRPSEWGEEQMVPYAELSERAKDLDRGTVRAVLEAIAALDLELRSRPPAAPAPSCAMASMTRPPADDPFGPPARVSDRPGPVFLAMFDTLCPVCDDEIVEGAEARMTPDGAVHAECVDDLDATDGGHTSYADGVPS